MSIRSMPCNSCPYRRDVPSGLWAWHEYEKLRDYDLPTAEQPPQVFGCHATPEQLCHGWAVCHQSRGTGDGHPYDLFALRLHAAKHGVVEIPEPGVPLFASGNDAADHGQRDIAAPGPEARAAVARLMRKYPRLEA